MTALREAAKAALWAFELHVQMTWPTDRSTAAIAALRAALAQEQAEPVQEPVAWYCNQGLKRGVSLKQESPEWIPLYTKEKP